MEQKPENEDELLRDVALQNARSIQQARERAERALVEAKRALERKTEELAHSLAVTRATLESTTDGILVTDRGGRITDYNRNYLDLWGTKEELLRELDHRALAEVLSAKVREPVRFIERLEEIYSAFPDTTYDLLETNGRRIIERHSLIQYVKDRKVGRVWSYRDVTEQMRAEEQLEKQVEERTLHLEQSIQSLESVCYTIAHDLRAPLRGMQGFAKILLDDYASRFDAPGRALGGRIISNALRMDALISDLLDYARISHTVSPLGELDPNPSLKNVIERFEGEVAEKNARIDIEQLPVLWAHRILFEQIVHNLIGNALKFVAAGARPVISIRAEEREEAVRLYIRDNGIGIRSEHQERIFKVFERLHKDEKEFPGTGVGLAIVKKGMEKMGGRAGIERTEKPGTCFFLDFQPVANAK